MADQEKAKPNRWVLLPHIGINPIAAFVLLAIGLAAFGYLFIAFTPGSSAATSLASSTPSDEIAATNEATAAGRTPEAAAAASRYAAAPFTLTYTNPTYGFSFHYPDGLAIGEWTDPSDNGDATTVLIQNVPESVFFQVDITPWGDPELPLTAALIEELAPQLQMHDARPITVGWWTFDGKDMIKNVADSSGQGNNGFLLNMSTTSVPGVFGQALKFVPPAGCAAGHTCTNVDIGNAASLNVATSTLTAWIYPTSVSGLQAIIASESNNGVEMLLNGSSLQSYADNAQGSICAAAGTIPVNKWSMVTASVGNLTSVDHLYVNGTEVTGTCFNGPLLFSSADWRLGGGGFFDHGAYNGFIDDVRVYNRTLSAAEVLQLYNLGH